MCWLHCAATARNSLHSAGFRYPLVPQHQVAIHGTDSTLLSIVKTITAGNIQHSNHPAKLVACNKKTMDISGCQIQRAFPTTMATTTRYRTGNRPVKLRAVRSSYLLALLAYRSPAICGAFRFATPPSGVAARPSCYRTRTPSTCRLTMGRVSRRCTGDLLSTR